MFYGAMVWDPWLIVAQIACIQALFYIVLGVFLWALVGPHVSHFTLKYFFDAAQLTLISFDGWCTVLGFLLTYLAGSLLLLAVVERTKKCLDFAATAFVVHLVLCVGYGGGVPSSATFWAVNGGGVVVMTLVGEWLCMRREQRDIPLSVSNRSSSS